MVKSKEYKKFLYYAMENLSDEIEWIPCGSTEKEALKEFLDQNDNEDVIYMYKLCAVYRQPKNTHIREGVL